MAERELLVVRHAKSSWKKPAPTDMDRPLAGRGKRDRLLVAAWLLERGLVPDVVFCSPAKRARKTAVRIASELGLPKRGVIEDDRIYFNGLEGLLEVLSEADGDRVMLVGHNPDLEDLVTHLNGGVPAAAEGDKLLPTCAVAHFRLPEDWGALPAGCGELLALVRPGDLAP